MRADALAWLAASDRDEAMALELLRAGLYEGSVFHGQQAAEKALKAVLLVQGEQPLIHSCVQLLRILGNKGLAIPAEVEEAARRLDIHYVASRYPNGLGGAPETFYDEKLAKEAIEWMKTIREFVKSLMP